MFPRSSKPGASSTWVNSQWKFLTSPGHLSVEINSDDVGRQALLVGIVFRGMTLRRTMLAEHLAGPPFRYRQYAADPLDHLTATGGT